MHVIHLTLQTVKWVIIPILYLRKLSLKHIKQPSKLESLCECI